jgi:hypothetical protein
MKDTDNQFIKLRAGWPASPSSPALPTTQTQREPRPLTDYALSSPTTRQRLLHRLKPALKKHLC